jgi:Putative MetA-pathway of phenol degradation
MTIRLSPRLGARILLIVSSIGLSIAGVAISAAQSTGAPATELAATMPILSVDPYHELETKYLFGFTEGADIGAEGEKSIELETTTEIGLRSGTYGTLEQELEFESVPTQNFGYELSAHGLGFSVNNVDGMNDAHGFNFSGLSAEFRYLVLGRGPESPFGFTLVAEPEWGRLDDGGQPATDYNITFRAIVDTELIANRLYAAANLIYNPDYSTAPGENWQRAAQYGLTGALAYRVAPKITLGGEAEYYRDYDSFGFQNFQGNALYLGPTLHIQFTGQTMLSLAWSTQVAGHAAGQNFGLDLTNFPQQRGNLKFEVEF